MSPFKKLTILLCHPEAVSPRHKVLTPFVARLSSWHRKFTFHLGENFPLFQVVVGVQDEEEQENSKHSIPSPAPLSFVDESLAANYLQLKVARVWHSSGTACSIFCQNRWVVWVAENRAKDEGGARIKFQSFGDWLRRRRHQGVFQSEA